MPGRRDEILLEVIPPGADSGAGTTAAMPGPGEGGSGDGRGGVGSGGGDPADGAQPERPESRPWWRRRWLVALAVVVAAIVIVVGPVRARVDGQTVKGAANAFVHYEDYEAERNALFAQLNAAATPDDNVQVDRAAAALDQEEAGHLQTIARQLSVPFGAPGQLRAAVVAVRGGLRTVGQALVADSAWQVQPAGTRGPEPAPPLDVMDKPAFLLGDELARMGRHLPKLATLPLHAADATLARLRVWSDQPINVTLGTSDGSGSLIKLDLDHSVATSVNLPPALVMPGEPSILIGRDGWTAAYDGESVAAFPDQGAPYEIQLPPGSSEPFNGMFAAIQPDAIWIVLGDEVVEIDSHGHDLGPIWTVPTDEAVTAVITGGFVLTDQNGALHSWTPATGALRPIGNGPGYFLAANGTAVAWAPWVAVAGAVGSLHITNVATGSDTVITALVGLVNETACAFSPDGSVLSCSEPVPGSTDAVYRLALVDPIRGTVTLVPGGDSADMPQASMVWTADSRRLFFVTTSQGNRSVIATWARNAPAATELRYFPPTTSSGGLDGLTDLTILDP